MLTPEMIAKGWLPHDGGPCPVPLDSRPTVLFRDGDFSTTLAKCWALGKRDWWRHEGRPGNDIIAYLPDPNYLTDYKDRFPIGCKVRKTRGSEWTGVVVGHYSSSLTPDGLVIECTAPGARHSVHVEPAKRMERDG